VTGADYFLGVHVARALADAGVDLRCLAPASPGRELCRSFVGGAETRWIDGDVEDPAALREASDGCRVVYHCDEDYRVWAPDPDRIYRHNVEGTRAVLRSAREAGVRRVVHTSSVGALGRTGDGRPADEETPASLEQMVGHYQRSKFLAERAVEEESAGDGPAVVTVNPPASVGEMDRAPTPVGGLIVDFLEGSIPAYIESGRSFVDVRDVARGHLRAAALGTPGERYALAGHNLTVGEFLEAVARVTGRAAPRWKLPGWVAVGWAGVQEALARIRGGEPALSLEAARAARQKMFFDGSKARRELGWEPGPLEPAIRRAVDWFREEGYLDTERAGGPPGRGTDA
jgi:dihydroflavonol-4-reductase